MKKLNRNQIIDWLIEIGWTFYKDEVNDKYCVYDLGGIKIEAGLIFRKYGEQLEVSMTPSVTTEAFSSVVKKIYGKDDNNGLEPIIVNFNDAKKLKLTEYTLQDIQFLSKSAIEWAEKQNIQKALEKYAELSTSCLGVMPLRHLAALAILKDWEKLNGYLHSFEQGNRLGFVNYITSDMIQRALTYAKINGVSLR